MRIGIFILFTLAIKTICMEAPVDNLFDLLPAPSGQGIQYLPPPPPAPQSLPPPKNVVETQAQDPLPNPNQLSFLSDNFTQNQAEPFVVKLPTSQQPQGSSTPESALTAIITGNTTGKANLIAGKDNVIAGQGNFIIGEKMKVLGSNNSAEGEGHVVLGTNNRVNGVDNYVRGEDNLVIHGDSNLIKGTYNYIAGSLNQVVGNANVAAGNQNRLKGENNDLMGDLNSANGNDNVLSGRNNSIAGQNNTLRGNSNSMKGLVNTIAGSSNTVIGHYNNIQGDQNKVFGNNNTVGVQRLSLGDFSDPRKKKPTSNQITPPRVNSGPTGSDKGPTLTETQLKLENYFKKNQNNSNFTVPKLTGLSSTLVSALNRLISPPATSIPFKNPRSLAILNSSKGAPISYKLAKDQKADIPNSSVTKPLDIKEPKTASLIQKTPETKSTELKGPQQQILSEKVPEPNISGQKILEPKTPEESYAEASLATQKPLVEKAAEVKLIQIKTPQTQTAESKSSKIQQSDSKSQVHETPLKATEVPSNPKVVPEKKPLATEKSVDPIKTIDASQAEIATPVAMKSPSSSAKPPLIKVGMAAPKLKVKNP